MKIIHICVLVALSALLAIPAVAQSWTGTPTIYTAPNNGSFYGTAFGVRCIAYGGSSILAPPCSAGSNLVSSNRGNAFPLSSLPSGSDSSNSGLGLLATGTIQSNTRAGGYCQMSANIPLASFADADTVNNDIAEGAGVC